MSKSVSLMKAKHYDDWDKFNEAERIARNNLPGVYTTSGSRIEDNEWCMAYYNPKGAAAFPTFLIRLMREDDV